MERLIEFLFYDTDEEADVFSVYEDGLVMLYSSRFYFILFYF